MSDPWMFEMSKHSIRRGSTSRSSRSRSARRISWDWRRGCFHSRSKARRALRTTRSRSRNFSPRCGTRIWTWVPRRRAQPRLEQLAVGNLPGHEDLPRHVAAGGRVVLLDGRGEHALGLGQLVEQVALARHHLAVAHGEHLDGRPLALHARGEEVALLEVGGRDLLGRLQPFAGPAPGRGARPPPRTGLPSRLPASPPAGASPPPPSALPGRAGRPRRTAGSGRGRRPRPRRGRGSA